MRMLAEQGPIGDTVTLSAANEIVGGEAGVFVPGDGVRMIADAIAILQQARAEFGIFRHAELGIEVSSGEDGPFFVRVVAMCAEVLSEKAIIGDSVVVAKEEDSAASGFYAEAASGSRATILLTNVTEIGIGKQEVAATGFGVIGGAVVDHDDFPARSEESLKSQRCEAQAELVGTIVGRDDDGEFEIVPTGLF